MSQACESSRLLTFTIIYMLGNASKALGGMR